MEPTSIYRFYRKTCQRVRAAYTVLNSQCTFIITSDRANKVVIWIGKYSSMEDKIMAEHHAILLRRQMPENGQINIITEGKETGIGLDHLTQVLWMTMDDYVKESQNRENNPPPPNCPKILYSVVFDSKGSRERSSSSSGNLSPSGTYYGNKSDPNKTKVCKLCTHVPDGNGTVQTMPFPGNQYSSVYLLCVGDQIDLWISDDCSQRNVGTAKSIALTISQEKLEGIKVNKKLEPVLFGSNIRYIREGYERCLFLSHFSNKSSFISKISLHEPTTCVEDLPQSSDGKSSDEKSSGADPVSQTFNRVARELGLWHLLGSIDSISSTLSSSSESTEVNMSRNNSSDIIEK